MPTKKAYVKPEDRKPIHCMEERVELKSENSTNSAKTEEASKAEEKATSSSSGEKDSSCKHAQSTASQLELTKELFQAMVAGIKEVSASRNDYRNNRDRTPNRNGRSASRDSSFSSGGLTRDEVEEMKKMAKENDPKLKDKLDTNWSFGNTQFCANCYMPHSCKTCKEKWEAEKLRFSPPRKTMRTLLRCKEDGTLKPRAQYAAENAGKAASKNEKR